MNTFFAPLLLFLTAATLPAQTPVFFWDMESENATIYKPGSDSTVRYYAQAQRSDSQAYAGSWSLRTGGVWAAAMFDNNTNDVVWAPVTEGTVELYWQYQEPWGDQMLFQMTGKSSNPLYDTNDGVGIRTRGGDPGEFFCGTARNLYHPITLVDGQWYRFRLRYKSDRGVSLQIDNGPQYASTEKTMTTTCVAWHQILIGNDRNSPMLQYIDNFAVYDHWLPDGTTPVFDMAASITANRDRAVFTNPVRDRIEFVLPAGDAARSLIIYDRTGRMIVETPCHGVSTAAKLAAPAGTYFYTLQTNRGTQAGSFIKIAR
jgi:hypothetical protein